MLNLLHDGTEINSFDDAYDVESQISDFKLRLQALRDLLTRDDAHANEPIGITTDGAYGIAYFFDDCKTIIDTLINGYFNIERNRKRAMEENCPEEKQEQADALAAGPVSVAAANENELPVDVNNNLFHQAGELSEAINIFSIIEDHHFTKLDSPVPCDEELERIGNLMTLATTKIILARNSIENMIGDDGARQFGLTGRSAL